MITRRLLLAAPPGALLLSSRNASAQRVEAVEAPNPQEVSNVLSNSQQYHNMLTATDALRLVLIVRLNEANKGSNTPQQDFGRWIEIRGPFQQEPFRTEVLVKVETKDGNTIIIDAAAHVTPTAIRIQNALDDGGVDGQVARDMVRSFYIFVQIRAVAEQKAAPANEAWYCSIYPFSYFCHQA